MTFAPGVLQREGEEPVLRRVKETCRDGWMNCRTREDMEQFRVCQGGWGWGLEKTDEDFDLLILK